MSRVIRAAACAHQGLQHGLPLVVAVLLALGREEASWRRSPLLSVAVARRTAAPSNLWSFTRAFMN